MRNLLLLLALSLTLFSCKKEKQETSVEVTVKDGSGDALSNFTVYQINATKWNLYGNDPFFKDAQSVTNSEGVATFLIDDLNFAVDDQATFYFFSEYTIGDEEYTAEIGVTIREGETKKVNLILD